MSFDVISVCLPGEGRTLAFALFSSIARRKKFCMFSNNQGGGMRHNYPLLAYSNVVSTATGGLSVETFDKVDSGKSVMTVQRVF